MHRSLEANARGLVQLRRILTDQNIQFIPSHANFVLTIWPSADEARHVTQALLEQGVIVRPLAAWGLPCCIRITIGSEDELDFLAQALHTAVEAELVV